MGDAARAASATLDEARERRGLRLLGEEQVGMEERRRHYAGRWRTGRSRERWQHGGEEMGTAAVRIGGRRALVVVVVAAVAVIVVGVVGVDGRMTRRGSRIQLAQQHERGQRRCLQWQPGEEKQDYELAEHALHHFIKYTREFSDQHLTAEVLTSISKAP
jgi:hypothetical protein